MKMKQEEVVIPLHRPTPTEMLFFLLCGVIMSVPHHPLHSPTGRFLARRAHPILRRLNFNSVFLTPNRRICKNPTARLPPRRNPALHLHTSRNGWTGICHRGAFDIRVLAWSARGLQIAWTLVPPIKHSDFSIRHCHKKTPALLRISYCPSFRQ